MKIHLIIATFTLFSNGTDVMAKEMIAEKNLEKVYYLAGGGNVKTAMEKMALIDLATLTPQELKSRKKFIDRFGTKEANPQLLGPSLVNELTRIFQTYWHKVLLQELSQEDGHHFLFKEIAPLVTRLGGSIGDFSELEFDRVAKFLTLKLKEVGYFSIIGNVSPHLNFMAWKSEKTIPYSVVLGDGQVQKVNVILMNDFVSLGWAAYATFDKLYVGGWVGDAALHCVASAYDLKSENFRISFLSHEARHFADIKKYPSLKSVDLEYRAKLNELFLSKKSYASLMKKFLLEQGDNRENPHSYASFIMIKNLSKKLATTLTIDSFLLTDRNLVRNYSAELLSEHTEKLNASKPLEIQSAL